ncbi:MAG TPA: pyridoxamine 5'-phosphate oxidase family protein [Gemmatimonadaceae bacterium]|nr:pyridoxamine 5'-phosphate oxidase family protein [Gemmatimonadaceae bacterium]
MPDEQPSVAAVATTPARTIVPLSDVECRAVLERQRLCVVSVVDDGEPYAVPVFYGFDGRTLYLGVAEGRKTRALDANSRVYIVVTEVGPSDAWRSVAIAGRARTLDDAAERQAAIDVLVAHNRRVRASGPPRDGPPPRRTGGRVLRIDDVVVTGRAFG